MFLLLLLLSSFNQLFYAQEEIPKHGIWNDDFQLDRNRLNGWNIFNKNENDPKYYNPENWVHNGANDKPYHGPFNKMNREENWMIRKFKCAVSSTVYVSYSFAFCDTENSDYIVAMNIDQTNNAARTDGMARPAQDFTDWP
eukprot:520186_1